MSSHQEPDLNIDGISEKDVIEYLHKHPRFFEGNLNLLSEMSLPHPSGNAISLIERQVNVLRDNNHKLEQKLNNLIQIARENDRLNARIQKMVLALMEAQGLDESIYALQTTLHEEFNADSIALRIFRKPNDPEGLDTKMFISRDNEIEELFSSFFNQNKPLCGALDARQADLLFEDNAEAIISSALVPIVKDNCFGILAIGSYDINRFHSAMGTVFLTYIGEMVGRSLDPHLQP